MLDAASVLAELTGEVAQNQTSVTTNPMMTIQRPRGRGERDKICTLARTDPALSAAITFDHAHSPLPSDDKSTSRISVSDVKADDAPRDPTTPVHVATADVPDADAAATQRFTLAVETTDTKPLPVAKAVVREQETHFEPVQQVTTLQKIVDRMATDLATVASPERARVADAPGLETNKAADSRPVRMMTLELDPPNLGSVTVKMRLAGDSVEIHLTADRYETTQMLRQSAVRSPTPCSRLATRSISRRSTIPAPRLKSEQRSAAAATTDAVRSALFAAVVGRIAGGWWFFGAVIRRLQNGARHNRQDHEQSPRPAERQQDRE